MNDYENVPVNKAVMNFVVNRFFYQTF